MSSTGVGGGNKSVRAPFPACNGVPVYVMSSSPNMGISLVGGKAIPAGKFILWF